MLEIFLFVEFFQAKDDFSVGTISVMTTAQADCSGIVKLSCSR